MRYAILVAIIAIVTALFFRVFIPSPPSEPAVTIMSIVSPRHLKVNQPYTIIAGVKLPEVLTRTQLLQCQNQRCKSLSSRQNNMVEQWDNFGSVSLEQGAGQLELVFYQPWLAKSERAVARYVWQVKAY